MDDSIIESMRNNIHKIDRDPHQKVYAPLAEGYRRTGLLDDAEDTANEGLDRFPSYLLCREILGKIYYRLGKHEQAKEQLERVARIVKDNVELSRLLAKVYLDMGMKEEALERIDFVLEKDPFDFEIRNMRIEAMRPDPQPGDESDDDSSDEASGNWNNAAVTIDPDSPDEIFGKSYDIESIIAGLDEPEVKDREQYAQATDEALDSLEDLEGAIDKSADQIFEILQNEEDDKDKSPIKTISNTDVFKDSRKQLRAAAQIGQVHMELHMLDEALIIAQRKCKEDPEDKAYQTIYQKIENALNKKEAELDDLEDMSLATGL